MKFKKIYIEITNICNLNCSFCNKTNKIKKQMATGEFEHILKKIDSYTDYVYLHIQGEPLLHNNLDEILKLCKKYHKKVNITTNATLLKEKLDIIKQNNVIRQINISLHSENNKNSYFEDIFSAVEELKDIYIVYRIWVSDKENEIITQLKKQYGKIIDQIYLKNNIKIKENLYLNKEEQFIWPSLDNEYYQEEGRCMGLKTHLAILSDGTVCACCLDANGISNLGNIFKEELKDILEKEKTKNIINSFNNNKAYLDICKHCSYKERFKK